MKIFLGRMQSFLRLHPWCNAALALLMVAGGLCAVLSAKFNENILDMLPARDKVITDAYESAEIFGQNRLVFINISTSTQGGNLAEISERLSEELSKIGELSSPYPSAQSIQGIEALEKAVSVYPYFFDQKTFEDHLSPESIRSRLKSLKYSIAGLDGSYYKILLLKDPIGILELLKPHVAAFMPKFGNAVVRGELIYSKNLDNALIIRRASFDPSDSQKSAALIGQIELAATKIKKDFPSAQIDIYGGHRISADNAKYAKEGSNKAMILSACIILALCLCAFKHRIYALFAPIPSVLGVCMAFVFLRIFSDEISSISIAFASIAVGISIDYAIHILYAADGDRGAENIGRRTQEIFKPIAIAASTTIIAFAIIPFMGGRSFGQLGIFGAAGVFFSAAVSLVMLPALISSIRAGRPKPCPFYPLSEWLWKISDGRNRICAVLFVLLVLSFAPFLKDLRFEGNISAFSGITKSTQMSADKIKGVWKNAVNTSQITLRAKSVEELMGENLKLFNFLKSSGEIENVDSLSTESAPSYETMLERSGKWKEYLGKNKELLKRRLENEAKKLGIKSSVAENELEILSAPPSLDDFLLDKTLFGFRIAKAQDGYAAATMVRFSKHADKSAFRNKLEEKFPTAAFSDTEFLGNHIAHLAKNWLLLFGGIALVAVMAHLWFSLGKISALFCVLVPVSLGIALSLSTLVLLGEPITLINAIFIIFAICIAQDYAVFILFAKMRASGGESAMKAVMLSAFTTTAAFGSLAVAEHPVLRGIGTMSALSIFFTFLATICLTPALFDMLVKGGMNRGAK